MVSLLVASFAAALTMPPQPLPPVIVEPLAGQVQEMVLGDGTRAIGRVENITDDVVRFRTASGDVLQVERSRIVDISVITNRMADRERSTDSNATRMLFSPTARSLESGEWYFGLSELGIPFVQVGLTDRISIGGGTPPFFPGGVAHPFWLTPKVQLFAGPKNQAAVGVVHLTSLGNGGAGIAYGVITHGTVDGAATVGLGYAYDRGLAGDGGAPVVMVGGERRVSRTVKLLTENYLFRGGGILSGGVRLSRKRRSIEFGLVAPLGGGALFVFPVVNLVRTFE